MTKLNFWHNFQSLFIRTTWHFDNWWDVLWAAFCNLAKFFFFTLLNKLQAFPIASHLTVAYRGRSNQMLKDTEKGGGFQSLGPWWPVPGDQGLVSSSRSCRGLAGRVTGKHLASLAQHTWNGNKRSDTWRDKFVKEKILYNRHEMFTHIKRKKSKENHLYK